MITWDNRNPSGSYQFSLATHATQLNAACMSLLAPPGRLWFCGEECQGVGSSYGIWSGFRLWLFWCLCRYLCVFVYFPHDISVAASWNLDSVFIDSKFKRSRFFEVSRPLRSPTCYACMVRLWNDLNIWSCVQLVVSIVVISMQLWKPMIWCPGGAKNKEVLRFAVELLGHIFQKTTWYDIL